MAMSHLHVDGDGLRDEPEPDDDLHGHRCVRVPSRAFALEVERDLALRIGRQAARGAVVYLWLVNAVLDELAVVGLARGLLDRDLYVRLLAHDLRRRGHAVNGRLRLRDVPQIGDDGRHHGTLLEDDGLGQLYVAARLKRRLHVHRARCIIHAVAALDARLVAARTE